MSEEFWSNRFHWCALAAGFLAHVEGRLHESDYVRDLAYGFYESGAFQQRLQNYESRNSARLKVDLDVSASLPTGSLPGSASLRSEADGETPPPTP